MIKRDERGLMPQPSDLFSRWMDDPFSTIHWPAVLGRFGDMNLPSADISETDREIMIEADVPGFEPENITVEISADAVVIEGRYEKESEVNGKKYHQKERRLETFYREFALPPHADIDKATSQIKNGSLVIHIPKKAEAKKKQLRVEKA